MGLARNSLGSFVENSSDSLFRPRIASSIPNTVLGGPSAGTIETGPTIARPCRISAVVTTDPTILRAIHTSDRAAWPRETSSSRRVSPAAQNLSPNCQRSPGAHPFTLFITHDFASLAKSCEFSFPDLRLPTPDRYYQGNLCDCSIPPFTVISIPPAAVRLRLGSCWSCLGPIAASPLARLRRSGAPELDLAVMATRRE